jgi:hypothetical protein
MEHPKAYAFLNSFGAADRTSAAGRAASRLSIRLKAVQKIECEMQDEVMHRVRAHIDHYLKGVK